MSGGWLNFRALAPGLCLVVSAVGAHAQQAAVSCEVADFTMTMRLYLPLAAQGHGAPGPEPLSGTVEIHSQKIPKDRRLWSLDGKRPAQFWNHANELKIMLVLGSGQEAIVITIETSTRVGEGEYSGSFRLTAPETKLTGKLAWYVG